MILLKALSFLPFPILYLFSDIICFFIRLIISYRKDLIINNLRESFPEKTEAEIQKILKDYYLNLSDLIVETLKTLSLSSEDLNKRVKIINPELPLQYLAQGKSIIALAGHLCNWEWLLAASMSQSPYPVDAVYKPLNNKFSDRLMLRIRSRFGANPVPMKDTLREQVKKKNIPHTLAMVADQTPQLSEIQFWTRFLNHDTPFYVGADKIGRMLQMPVFFAGMRRVSRGHYEIYFREIATPPFPEQEFFVIEEYARILEEEIHRQPSNWLWSHRRWKHKRPS